jgi:ribonuclease R
MAKAKNKLKTEEQPAIPTKKIKKPKKEASKNISEGKFAKGKAPLAKKPATKIVEQKPTRDSKEEKLFQNLLKTAQQFMLGKGFQTLSEHELIDRLSIPPQHHPLFREVLSFLLAQGFIALTSGKYTLKKDSSDIVSGILRVHPRGFGFLQPDQPTQYLQDIFIPKHLTKNAVDGDNVEVQVSDFISEKGPEGKVIAILTRGRTHMAGIVRAIEGRETIAYVPLLGTAQRVVVESSPSYPQLQVGDRIVMEVLDWGSKDTETIGRVSHYIGHISDPSCDIKAVIEEYEIRADFPAQVIEEAQKFGKQVSQKEIRAREDLRETECFTIDPDTAKDFDDALSLTKDKAGHYHLGVHIADVSHYVRPGSALDTEAKLRCNSTYFPGTCIPMLPGALSENLCSLKADVNRLTVSVFVEFDPEGNMIDYRIARTVIKSTKRFTYRQAKEVLDGKTKSRHLPTLQLMVELCGLMKKKRYERGSIEFALPELVVMVDDKGVPYKTDYISYDITHQLVEEFMLKANELVAWHLSQQGKNLTYRIHDVPAEENMKDFSILVGAFGFQLSDKPTPQELQKLFDEALDTPYGQYLATSYIRRMRLAMYSPQNIGHYGLGLTHYCHFTSPIRRYVDLVVHRILFGESDDLAALEAISTLSSEQERISAKAENHVVLLKKLRLLNTIHEKEPLKQYEAIVTRVKNFGLTFEVIDFMLEGFLHVSELEDDYYVYEDASVRLRGVHSGVSYCSGDKITVMLKDVNFIVLESQWNFVAGEESPREGNKKSFPSKKHGKGKHKKHKKHDRHNKHDRHDKQERKQGSSGSSRFNDDAPQLAVAPVIILDKEKRTSPPKQKGKSAPIEKKSERGFKKSKAAKPEGEPEPRESKPKSRPFAKSAAPQERKSETLEQMATSSAKRAIPQPRKIAPTAAGARKPFPAVSPAKHILSSAASPAAATSKAKPKPKPKKK